MDFGFRRNDEGAGLPEVPAFTGMTLSFHLYSLANRSGSR